jgi:hypothetical protein
MQKRFLRQAAENDSVPGSLWIQKFILEPSFKWLKKNVIRLDFIQAS